MQFTTPGRPIMGTPLATGNIPAWPITGAGTMPAPHRLAQYLGTSWETHMQHSVWTAKSSSADTKLPD